MAKKMYKTAVVCGKFYPPHKGHHFLIDKACEFAEKVTVLLCWRADETIPVELRKLCLEKRHPNVEVLSIPCIPKDDDSAGWGKYTLDILGYKPDVVLSSEAYGEPYAKAMGCNHIMVDAKRETFQISGTMIRNDPFMYFDQLDPLMRAFYTLRIVIVGAESTGTTTLAEALAEHYKTVCVPEYGRTYTRWKYEKDNDPDNWDLDEFTHIAKMQNELESWYAGHANKVLICDTDSFATAIWQIRYCGEASKEVLELGTSRNTYYILTGDEIPFVQDEDNLRDGEQIRSWMHREFITELTKYSKKFIIVKGSHDKRMRESVRFITNIIAGAEVI